MGIADNTSQKGYCIYAHLNLINDKVYIGISKDVKKRWRNKEHGYKHCGKIYNAFKKYGWDNFAHIVMWDNLSWEEACEQEKLWIWLFKFAGTSYNMTDGGEGRTGCTFSKEALEKIRTASLGRKWSEEQKAKVSKAKRESLACCKKVYCFDIKTKKLIAEYPSINSAASVVGTSSTNISSAIKGKNFKGRRIIAGGFLWSLDPTINKDDPRYTGAGESRAKKIYCYDLYGNYLKTYNSAYSAAEDVGGSFKAIHACCHKKKVSYMGYIWRYELCNIEEETLNKVQFRRHETNKV